GVKKLFDQGYTACMVTSDHNGEARPLFLKDVTDENGKVRPRLVNMDSPKAQLVFENGLQFLGKSDYETAGKYVTNPAEFDFLRILKWE
ncbi:MAG TPA: hypothetical protein VLH16_02460, partial [Bacteroidales bacterium]|nr:hypothetical protein [Bacteroidales bacterium]